MKYIAYYRVSTAKQSKSALGLDAQTKTVQDFITGDKRRYLVGEYKDIESGKRDDRPQLVAAIAHAKKTGATLLIAKLDRLSRNVSFIFTLRDSKVQFTALDLPDANTLTVGIFATIAQHEREIISKRTKDALAAKKRRGFKLGTPSNLTPTAMRKGGKTVVANAKNDPNNRKAREFIAYLRRDGLTYQEISNKLNTLGYKTRRERGFFPTTVQRLFERAAS